MTYRQTGIDFFQGPMMNSAAYSTAMDSQWNRLWKINKTTIDSFIYFNQTGLPVGYVIPQIIIDWPANGNVSLGQSAKLAPYFDSNNDNFYDPNDGDYPLIKGDQAIFFLYNDDRNNHTETGSLKLGIEIQGLLYAFNCNDSAIQNTIYANYKITNKSVNNYDSTYVGNWLDLDHDRGDFFGTEVARGAYFYYGKNNITSTYGFNQPSLGVVFLNGPYADSTGIDETISNTPHSSGYGDGIIDNEKPGLGKSISYINTSSPINGNPASGMDYYDYLKGIWKNGADLTYGDNGYSGILNCDYMFPENSDTLSLGIDPPQSAWYNYQVSPSNFDKSGAGSYGPFTFRSNQTIDIDLAFVIGRNYTDTNFSASVSVMKQRIDCVRSFYESMFTVCGCQNITGIDINQSVNSNLSLYPNPSSDLIYIDYKTQSKNAMIAIYDVKGQLVKQMKLENQSKQTVNVSSFASGLYLMVVTDGKNVDTQRFIKQ
jgi:hypothetical protein